MNLWNWGVLNKMETGRLDELTADPAELLQPSAPDMGSKHFAFVLGGIGGQFRGAKVHAYGPAYGMGAAIVEFRL